ncbi:hypothetical protein BU17DRAFT_80259 [Hysterangium stoloniferum]|nr:hypothetical protein BU17DRAFT_80259 [Hysterangium stoloniferum]
MCRTDEWFSLSAWLDADLPDAGCSGPDLTLAQLTGVTLSDDLHRLAAWTSTDDPAGKPAGLAARPASASVIMDLGLKPLSPDRCTPQPYTTHHWVSRFSEFRCTRKTARIHYLITPFGPGSLRSGLQGFAATLLAALESWGCSSCWFCYKELVRDVEDGLGGRMWPAGHYIPQTTDAPEDSVDGWMQTESIENEDIVLFLTLGMFVEVASIAHLFRSASNKKWHLGYHVAPFASHLTTASSANFSTDTATRRPRFPARSRRLDLHHAVPPVTALPAHYVLPRPLSLQQLGSRQPHPLSIAAPACLVRPQLQPQPTQPRRVDIDPLALLAHLGAAAAHADADGVPESVGRSGDAAMAQSREALMMGAGRATPPPPFDAPGNPGAGPGPGDSLTSLRSVGDGDGEEAGMVTVPQSLGRPSLEAAGEDGSGPAAAETPVGGRMSLSSGAGAGAGEKTLDSDDMSGDTSLASIMDASISTPETTFTVGHPPPDVSKDTPVPLSLALYIPGVPATTAAAKSAPTPPPTPPSQHSHSQRQS